jgi:hypothetical protein
MKNLHSLQGCMWPFLPSCWSELCFPSHMFPHSLCNGLEFHFTRMTLKVSFFFFFFFFLKAFLHSMQFIYYNLSHQLLTLKIFHDCQQKVDSSAYLLCAFIAVTLCFFPVVYQFLSQFGSYFLAMTVFPDFMWHMFSFVDLKDWTHCIHKLLLRDHCNRFQAIQFNLFQFPSILYTRYGKCHVHSTNSGIPHVFLLGYRP